MTRSDLTPYKAARDSLLAFMNLLYPNYQINWHIVEIAKALNKVKTGEIKRLLIEAPPRHSKSLHVSHYFPAWFMGHFPDQEVMHITYAQKFANKWGGKVRDVIDDPLYKKIFPGVELSKDTKAKDEFSLTKGAEYHALGIDGQGTGKGLFLGVIDDPYKNRKQAESELWREQVMETFRSAIYTRMAPDARLICMMTRWHEDDMIGQLTNDSQYSKENWHVLSFPAVNEDETEALWPDRFPLDVLMNYKRVLGPYDWNALYLQKPSSKEGNIFKRQNWRFHNFTISKYDRIIQSWDLAFKGKKESDYVVGQIWGKKGPNIYLLDQFRGKADVIRSIDAVLQMTEKWKEAKIKLIEDKANGPATLTILRRKLSGLKEINPGGSKVERAEAVKYMQECGNVYLPRPSEHPWVSEYIDEFSSFPNAKHDDQVDASTQAWQELDSENPVEKMRQALLGY